MDIYSNRSTYKLIIILFALVIGGLSVVYTNDLVNKLADRERKLIDLSAKGYKEIASAEFSESQGFLFKEIIEANTSVPVILADEEGNYISHRNFEAPKRLSPEKEADYFKAQIAEMKKQYPPILIEIAGLKQYIYYRNSDLINQLRYYPFIQLAVIGLFVIMGYLAFSLSKNAEQNRVWVGLAKETAHQLGTPISSLIAWAEYLKTKPEIEEEGIVEEMDKDIQRLQMITARFSSIGSEQKLQLEDLGEMVEGAISYLRSRVSQRVSIQVKIQPEGSQVMAFINRPLLEWVVENITKNAVDAMAGEGKLTLEITELTEGNVQMDITDTGKGIPRNQFKKVFEPGFTTKKRGWGLGLTLARRIVEQYHKGRIFVKSSEPGKGTTFRILLRNRM
ncbi:MAG TPA: HAMP domain-containing sensor histidine kinase [Catalimonadaceae bacterium]|nr:HAMP domain-containing sensor histidine kinase [Catalimonadaceae bacterium]HPI09737.1 HAMP domain-containing sensor histidine kinase [Catalimonadaceae bacterium]